MLCNYSKRVFCCQMFFRVFPLKKTLFLKTRKCRILARKNSVLAYLSMRGALFFAFIDFAYSISKIRLETGNIVPVRIPVDTFVSAETSPATDGARVAPTSPARASIANISVPPPIFRRPARLRRAGSSLFRLFRFRSRIKKSKRRLRLSRRKTAAKSRG